MQKYVGDQKNIEKKIAQEDELDGIPNYEPKSPIEDEQEENEVEIKKPIKRNVTTKKNKKGITKSINIQDLNKFSISVLNFIQNAKSYIK